jgi:transposase
MSTLHTPHKYLSLEQRFQIISLRLQQKSWSEICKATGFSRSTVRSVVTRFLKHGTYHDLPKSGHPRKIDARGLRRLGRAVLKDPCATAEDLAREATLDSGIDAVKRALKELRFGVYVARKKFWLHKVDMLKRKRWCRKYRIWEKEEWRKIIWSDEVRIEVGVGVGGPIRVRRRPGTGHWSRYLRPNFKSGRFSINFWAAYTYGSRTPLVFIRRRKPHEYERKNDKGGLNARQYIAEVLEPHLLPYWKTLNGNYHHLRFMHDGAGPHRARKVQRFLSKNGIRTLGWPAHSPDLNPIENAWRILKQRLKKRFRQRHCRPRNAAELRAAAQEEWGLISQRMLDKLVDTMPQRIQDVIKAKGGRTRW